MKKTSTLRVAAVGDLHYSKHTKGRAQQLFTEISAVADIALLAGDLTDYGLPEEGRLLLDDIHSHLKIPAVAVLGNHDQESGLASDMLNLLDEGGVEILDGGGFTYRDVGIAGVSGFGGGFGARMLNAWGEPIIKAFVQEAVDQSLKLEKALSSLETEKKLALLHYAPIRDTVIGEDPEIFPFCGSSRLESVCDRFQVQAIFHGHVHHGTPTGHTTGKIPVYNVAWPLLSQKTAPEKAFLLLEV